MKNTVLHICTAEQISMQQPLCEDWMAAPSVRGGLFASAVEADYRSYLSPNEARRMAPIMKRAVVTAQKALHGAGIEHPDAIITGTGLGNIGYTNKFLHQLTEDNEQFLKPTFFMQSTHNTIGSTLGIHTRTHGYNTTYSHGGVSFELALQDAFMQARLRRISTALVGGYDEMGETYFRLLQKTGYVGAEGMCPCGEVAVSMVLSTDERQDSLCELSGITVAHGLSVGRVAERLQDITGGAGVGLPDIDVVLTGVNGNPENDRFYEEVAHELFAGKPLAGHKPVFGENYTSSALAVYAAAHCLDKGVIPPYMFYAGEPETVLRPSCMLLVNRSEEQDFSLILLRKICC